MQALLTAWVESGTAAFGRLLEKADLRSCAGGPGEDACRGWIVVRPLSGSGTRLAVELRQGIARGLLRIGQAEAGQPIIHLARLDRTSGQAEYDGKRCLVFRRTLRLRARLKLPPEAYWAFDPTDFDTIVDDIAGRPLIDDRLVALRLAVRLFVLGKRPRKWRERT